MHRTERQTAASVRRKFFFVSGFYDTRLAGHKDVLYICIDRQKKATKFISRTGS